jgi:hypothetical protein
MEHSAIFESIWKTLDRTAKMTEENQRMIGYLGNKWGSFAEAMALPSMQRILEDDFGMTTTQPRIRIKKDGKIVQEIDMLAHSNGDIHTAIVVEVKSDLKGKDVDQVLAIMDKFFELFPEHKGKKLYGIIAYIDASEEGKNKALKNGLYLANIHDEVFEMKTPMGFIPKDFSK